MFTDESRLQLSHSDGRIRVYRRRGERYAQCCIVERDGVGSVGGSGVALRHNIAWYRSCVNTAHALRFNRITARVVQQFMNENEIEGLQTHCLSNRQTGRNDGPQRLSLQ